MAAIRSPLFWTFAIASTLLAGCAERAVSGAANDSTTSPAKQGDPRLIRIVSSLPRTGSARQQTDTIVNGIRMALEEAHDRVGDFRIDYVDRDDATASAGEWTPELETANANAATADPDVMIYIGPYNSGAAKISMPILNQATADGSPNGKISGLLMISPSNTSPGLTKPNPFDPREPGVYRPTGKINYVRVVPTDDLQGPLGADWAKAMGMKRIFVLDDQEVYGQGLAQLFAQRCDDIGLNVIGYDSVDAHELEFRSLMTRIKALHPDLIYFGGTTETKGGQIAKDMVAVGLKAKLMVPDGCMEQGFIESAGAENLNGRCYVTFGGLPSEAFETGDKAFNEKHAAQKQFVDHYKQRFGHLPEAYAVYGYEAAKVALEAIRRAGSKDRAAIIAACLAIRDFHGALGTWSFDANGDTTLHRLSGNIVRRGKFEFDRLLGD
ncbi:MAG TPA: branched-chain amino acid ABC transporter substrate-binding protein [Pirellulales bacterium]|nr:branched-chain amino acid ABC transporter substrate-binding protein [Pirellulales bacterium]